MKDCEKAIYLFIVSCLPGHLLTSILRDNIGIRDENYCAMLLAAAEAVLPG
jgi:hypothetical protein